MAKNSRGVCLWLSLAPGEVWRISGGILAEFGYHLNFKHKAKGTKTKSKRKTGVKAMGEGDNDGICGPPFYLYAKIPKNMPK